MKLFKKWAKSALLIGVAGLVAIPSIYLAERYHNKYTYLVNDERVDDNHTLNFDYENAIWLKGDILNGLYGNKGIDLRGVTEDIREMVRGGAKEVTLIINSGGGVVNHASYALINYLKLLPSMGVRVNCVVDGTAASMALAVYTACSHRYATPKSRILWHSIARSGQMRVNAESISKLFDWVEAANSHLLSDLKVFFYPWYFMEHFRKESMLPVGEIVKHSFGFLRVINAMEHDWPTIKKRPVKSLKFKVRVGKSIKLTK